MLFYILDPVKEYGCSPWPEVENLIKKCLKENPQERPTSCQVLHSLFIWFFYDRWQYKVVVSEKESGIKLMRITGFFLLFFSGMETAMKYCLLLPSRINCSIEVYQPRHQCSSWLLSPVLLCSSCSETQFRLLFRLD